MFKPRLNRQPGPLNENALEMLREKGLKRMATVQTTDDFSLGDAIRLHLRPDDINPDLKLYAAYLEVSSRALGTHFYVPTDFIADYDPDEQIVSLSVTLKVAQDELWDRELSFIAGNKGGIEALVD